MHRTATLGSPDLWTLKNKKKTCYTVFPKASAVIAWSILSKDERAKYFLIPEAMDEIIEEPLFIQSSTCIYYSLISMKIAKL